MIDLIDDSMLLMGRPSGGQGKHDHKAEPLVSPPPPPKADDTGYWVWGVIIAVIAWTYFQNT